MSDHDTNRRKFLAATGATGLASVAGCLGFGGGGGGGGDDGFSDAAAGLNLGESWEQRRFNVDGWSMDARTQVPPRSAGTWTNSQSFQSAVQNEVWAPPDGWDDTAAGDVDSLQILNHGAVNMEFDPATLATHELFEEMTGISIDPIEIGVDQANQREQQFLSSEQSAPHAFNVTGALLPGFVGQGWIETTDALYPEGGFEPYIPALQSLVQWDIDSTREGTHTYGYPNIAEGSVGHIRPDLLQEQGIDPNQFQGEWTWDLLERTMETFADTGVFGYAYFAGNATYLSYSYRELLYQQGARMVQDDGTVKVDTDASITVVQKMKEWRDKGWVPGDVISYGEGDIVDLFLSGQLAFTTGFTDFVSQAVNQFEPNTQYRPVVPPAANTGPSPSQAALVDPNTTSINLFADTGHKLAAMLYGDLRLSYVSQWWELTYESNLSFIDQVYTDAGEGGALRFGDVFGNAVENGVAELFPRMNAVFQQMTNPVQQAIQGSIAPEEAMSQVQEFVDSEVNNQ